MTQPDAIEVFCDKCRASTDLPFESSFEDQIIPCPKCGAAIYWKSCKKCETGYYSSLPDKPCPGCSPTNETPRRSSFSRKFSMRRTCPWCGKRAHFGYVSRAVVQCSQCGKYCTWSGMFVGALLTLGYLLVVSMAGAVFDFTRIDNLSKGPKALVLGLIMVLPVYLILTICFWPKKFEP